jgi:ABC-type branched-subunit amino acid transport system ATPase component
MGQIRIAEDVRRPATNWPLVSVEALSKSFGAVAAISNLNFMIEEGEIVGLGGSGGSTVVDLLAGRIKPTFGSITIADADMTLLGPNARNYCGVVHGLNPVDLFMDLTAHENILLGAAASLLPLFSRRGGSTYYEKAEAVLKFIGLAGLGNMRAADLSPSEQRFLMIGAALAAKPPLLILDSVTAGMTQDERSAVMLLIDDIRDNGMSVLITGHDMWSLTHLCDRILVLSAGRLIADDVPAKLAPIVDAGLSHAITPLSRDPILI